MLVQEATMMLRKCEPTLSLGRKAILPQQTYGKDDVVRTKLDKYFNEISFGYFSEFQS